MTVYSKFNVIYRLQKWLDSVPGQTFMNYAYSWGASIVILGTLFKLTHLPGANFMLFLGMGTEVIVFFIAAFDRPFDKTADGMDLPTHVADEAVAGSGAPLVVGGSGPVVLGGGLIGGGAMGEGPIAGSGAEAEAGSDAEAEAGSDAEADAGGKNAGRETYAAGGVIGGGIISGGVIGGGPVINGGVIGGGAISGDSKPDAGGETAGRETFAASGSAIAGGPVVGGGAISGGGIISGGPVVVQQPMEQPMGEELKEATSKYIDELNRLTEMLTEVSEQSKRLTRDSEEMENLNRTLTGISRVYEMQLKSASSQISTIDEINEQTKHMAEQIQELNRIYARMIEAMQVKATGPLS